MALFDDLRAAWGARPPRDKNDLTYVAPSRRTEFMNHWNGGPTGLSAASDHARCLSVIKADQDFHMDGRGWNDIGYNGAICPHARAIECRGIDYAGAHCPDHNTTAYGWQFMLGKGETATPAMFDRMARALADCEAHSSHDLRRLGHRDGYPTECPGDQIEAWVKAGMPGTTTTTGGFLMALSDADQQKILDAANRVLAYGSATPRLLNDRDGTQLRKDIGYARDQILTALDPAKFAAAVVAKLPNAATATQADVEAALRNVLGSLDAPQES